MVFKKSKKRISEILRILHKNFPEAKTALKCSNAFELLIATILSAQCTDKQVNKVMKNLVKKYPSPYEYTYANPIELEQDIKPTGFYKNKAKNIIACCKKLIEDFEGKVPDNMVDLVSLPGVGRKTASVVLGNHFNIPSIAVDTHVNRVSRRLGLTSEEKAEKIELDLMKVIPKDEWIFFSNSLILHGRYICKSKKPDCLNCDFNKLCPSKNLYI
ncbi:MAG: endonuclease III [Actinobacteria bacterium]|nr:endonuclease III [Actinomycetota bacterium]